LFDDDIEPEAAGYALDPSPWPDGDGLLRERTKLGDCVLRVRVVTVTSHRSAVGTRWSIGLRTLERLSGEWEPDPAFALDVPPTAPGAEVLKTFDSRLVGVTLVAFLRAFAHPGGAPDVHFHLARADKDEVRAVLRAKLLADVR
jgi:hypothetical protein